MAMHILKQLLIQVLPQLKPGRCGISDQALLLAGELRETFGIESAFVVLNSDERCEVAFPVIHCSPDQLVNACEGLSDRQPAALLVHLSGYGYEANGAPARLAEALAQVRSIGKYRIAVYFHELFASSMPWRSAFWDRRTQRRVVRRIAENSDLLTTSIATYARWLESEPKKRPGAQVVVLQLFSAVGETETPTPFAQRDPTIAVFGLQGTRQRAYKELAALNGMLRELEAVEILDFGPGEIAPSEIAGLAVRRMGACAADELAKQLSRTRFGFLSYTGLYIAKSSVFASYCAQGTIPLIATPFSGEPDGLKDGVHLASPRTIQGVKAAGWERCSNAVWKWYSGHRLRVHAETYAQWMRRRPVERMETGLEVATDRR